MEIKLLKKFFSAVTLNAVWKTRISQIFDTIFESCFLVFGPSKPVQDPLSERLFIAYYNNQFR